MASITVKIVDGKFVDYEGKYFDYLKTDSFSGNGWEGAVREDGSLHLEATREYSDGIHSVECDVQPSGKYVTKKNGEIIKRGKYSLTEGKLNGEFRLPGGNIDDRYVAYRDVEFKDFLETRGITAVYHKDPNGEYRGFNNHSGWGDARYNIATDGIVEEIGFEDLTDESWNDSLNSSINTYKVSNATYAIVTDSQDYRDNHHHNVMLNTLAKDVTKLDIPQKRFSEYHREKERFMRGEIDYGKKLPNYVLNDDDTLQYVINNEECMNKYGREVYDHVYEKAYREHWSQHLADNNQTVKDVLSKLSPDTAADVLVVNRTIHYPSITENLKGISLKGLDDPDYTPVIQKCINSGSIDKYLSDPVMVRCLTESSLCADAVNRMGMLAEKGQFIDFNSEKGLLVASALQNCADVYKHQELAKQVVKGASIGCPGRPGRDISVGDILNIQNKFELSNELTKELIDTHISTCGRDIKYDGEHLLGLDLELFRGDGTDANIAKIKELYGSTDQFVEFCHDNNVNLQIDNTLRPSDIWHSVSAETLKKEIAYREEDFQKTILANIYETTIAKQASLSSDEQIAARAMFGSSNKPGTTAPIQTEKTGMKM